MTQSYITIINALNQFADNHLSVQRFKTSFFEQIDNFSSADNTFPILYAVPSDVTFDQYVDRLFFRVYCVDILQKDRSNESAILNDTLLTLRDLYNWLKIADNGLNVLSTARAIPVNNFLVDYTAGWYIDIEIEGQAESNDCSIPFSENFIITGYTCDYTYVSNFLTCDTLEECQAIIDINTRIDNIIVSADTFVVNGSYDNPSGTLSLERNDGNILSITGFTTGATGGGGIFTGGTVTGPTDFLNGLTSTTISATTYLGLPTDVFISGGTYSDGTIDLTNTTGGTIQITGLFTGGTSGFDVFVTGGTYNAGTATFTNNTGGTFNVTGFATPTGGTGFDVFVTGATYSNGTAIFTNNTGGTFSLTGLFTGQTFNDVFVTGGTYNAGTAIFTNNTGGTFSVSGFSTGGTVTVPSGATTGSFGITIDGLGGVISSGQKGYVSIPYNGTITGWDIFSDAIGSCVIDVWKDSYVNFPPTVGDSIAGTQKPTLSGQIANRNNNLTGWTTTITAGDVIGFNVEPSPTGTTRVNLIIKVTKS
jgi:hypothetical protein